MGYIDIEQEMLDFVWRKSLNIEGVNTNLLNATNWNKFKNLKFSEILSAKRKNVVSQQELEIWTTIPT